MASVDNGTGKVELTVKFERARMHGKGARGRTGPGGLVNDTQLDTELR